MKFSEQWLREWVDPPLDSEALCEQLSMAGLEVDTVEPATPPFNNIVVAEVRSVQPHPDADKLRLCQVDDGGGETLQIVCGAANVAQGMKVPLARVGAQLPDGMKIKQARLRGVESFGMLCSAAELGLAEQADGLLPLPADAPVGTDIREYLQLDDNIIDIDLTPNRGDCLSIVGVAREVAAFNDCSMKPPEMQAVDPAHEESRDIDIENAADCWRYAGRILKGVNQAVETPIWMVERLRRAGLRPIVPVVDVTNYVMLELGQPMHAFDLDKLQGGIQVRRGVTGEALTTLDGEELQLGPDDLVISDQKAPVALAGVMGGLESSVTQGTRDILLESACFTPAAVAGTGRRHKLHTDSLHRFERGVDPDLQVKAIERATQLIMDLCGGEPGPVFSEGAGAPDSRAITLRHRRLNRLLGFEVPAQTVESILQRLSMQIEKNGDGAWKITPPGFRYDIAIEPDLIEEVVRIHGYDKLPDRPQQVVLPQIQVSEARIPLERIREAMIHRGYQEAVTYSFVDPEKQGILAPDAQGIDLDNPIARQMGQMRTSLWCGLLEALSYNLQRQQGRVRLFEVGMRFEIQANEIKQQRVISGLAHGPDWPEQWGAEAGPANFYTVKADIEALLSLGGRDRQVSFEPGTHPALHPGVCAEVFIDGKSSGYMGSINPKHLKLFDLKKPAILFELDLPTLSETQVPRYQALSEFPAMRRDLALLVPDQVTGASLLKCAGAGQEEVLEDVFVFDVYHGPELPSGFKSVALGLIFQDKSRTLTEREIDTVVNCIQERLREQLDANIRG